MFSALKKFLYFALPALPVVAYGAPQIWIPLGSYMKSVNLSRLRVHQNFFAVYRLSDVDTVSKHTVYSAAGSGLTAYDCWVRGFDIIYGTGSNNPYLSCNRRLPRVRVNAADFLYSELVPYGEFLSGCTGLLVTKEESNTYLYATCDSTENGETPQRLNITDCPPGSVALNHTSGLLSCSGSTSYQSTSQTGETHPVSRFIPRGNYLLSCKNIKFFPCLGTNAMGRLEADCGYFTEVGRPPGTRTAYRYKSTFLDNGSSVCRMDMKGFVSNINGELTCDPEQPEFNRQKIEPEFRCRQREL